VASLASKSAPGRTRTSHMAPETAERSRVSAGQDASSIQPGVFLPLEFPANPLRQCAARARPRSAGEVRGGNRVGRPVQEVRVKGVQDRRSTKQARLRWIVRSPSMVKSAASPWEVSGR
jgi:hypothetical protein